MSVMLECQAVKVTNSEPGLGDITLPGGSLCVGSEGGGKTVFNFQYLIDIKDQELQ